MAKKIDIKIWDGKHSNYYEAFSSKEAIVTLIRALLGDEPFDRIEIRKVNG